MAQEKRAEKDSLTKIPIACPEMVIIGVSRADITDNNKSIEGWRRDNRLSLSFLAKIEEEVA
jgi:predicted secreted protein